MEDTQNINNFKLNILQNILLFLGVIFFMAAIIETTFYFLNLNNDYADYAEKTNYVIDFLPVNKESLGYTFPENVVGKMKFYNEKRLIYSFNFTTDEFGRRKTKEKLDSPHLLIFGGSFIFGDGLEDNQTAPYFLSELTNYRVYNYAQSGWGTGHMLAHLERVDFSKEISNKSGVAIYVFIPDHTRRVIGDMVISNYGNWRKYFPYYDLNKEDEIIRKGNFTINRPITTRLYQMLWHSNTVRYFNLILPLENKKHTYLTYKIIEKAKEVYEEKFNGTFYVLIHPSGQNSSQSKDLLALLKENNINVLLYPINYYRKGYMIPDDIHPSAEFNEILAAMVAEDLNKIDNKTD